MTLSLHHQCADLGIDPIGKTPSVNPVYRTHAKETTHVEERLQITRSDEVRDEWTEVRVVGRCIHPT
jgi:hypothetical protein